MFSFPRSSKIFDELTRVCTVAPLVLTATGFS